jgi:Ice-binding-like
MRSFNKLLGGAAALSLVLGLAGPFAALADVPAAVNLQSAGNFVILAKAGISTTGATVVTGDIGVSPAAATFITGFGLSLAAGSSYATSSLVSGKVYAPDYADPTPANITAAVGDMETAYTDAAGRTNPTATELGAGNIGGLTLAPGLYKWGTGVTIPSDVTLAGGANDVWIFQIAQNLDVSSGVKIVLSGGAIANNVFWAVAGQTTIGTTAVFNGNILDQTAIVMNTGATLNGRALAQTAVTLDADTVTVPSGTQAMPPVNTPPANTPPANMPPVSVSPPAGNVPSADANISGSYSVASALANTTSIGVDKGIEPTASSVNCTANTLIKGSAPAVYYCGANGKRYVFVNDKAYFTWYGNFLNVATITDAALALIPIGGNVTYRPGTRMVKVQSDPRVYVVARGGVLRAIPDEATAHVLFGPQWNKMIDDISDAFFVNYTVGAPIPAQ